MSIETDFTNLYSYSEPCFEHREAAPFNELILSWNGTRPSQGEWIFHVSLYQNGQWSPWLPYAKWSKEDQRTFKVSPHNSFAQTYQDAVSPKEGFCTGFRVQIEGSELEKIKNIWVSCSNTKAFKPSSLQKWEAAPPIPLLGLSQMRLDHPRHRDLCSPTSTTNVINYLAQTKLNPLDFAARSHDNQFDIYGNWILNTAAACEALQGHHHAYVTRLNSFEALLAQLRKGLPVVVSVKGTIEGAPQPYPNGHLLCVTGYDAEKQTVLCVDSACLQDEQTTIAYPLQSFLTAWETRLRLAYLFDRQ